MPIVIEWDNKERSVIRQTFSEKWTWQEFYVTNQERIPEMMRSVSHIVHIFSDFSNSDRLPLGGALTHARNVMEHYPPNWGILVIVGASQFVNVLVEMFRKLFSSTLGKKTFTAPTIQDAYRLVRQYEANSRDQTTFS